MKLSKFLFFICLLFSVPIFSQIRTISEGDFNQGNPRNKNLDSLRKQSVNVKLSGKTKYTDYRIFTLKNDTTYIDTTLTLLKERKFNFLRKDLFELLPFHNIGQTFNNLAYSFTDESKYPDMGFRAKQFFYLNYNDISYYKVPTPTSEIMFKSTLEQGQFLESFFTANFSERFNLSIAYTGLRSLGKYRESLASQGNFRATFNYETPKGQYSIRGHVVAQDLLNEESGGLPPISLEAFITNDENFTDRGRMDVNLTDTENELTGQRLFIEHDYKILSSKDSISNKDFSNLKIGHQLLLESKDYEFRQASTSDFLGTPGTTGSISDKTEYSFSQNQVYLEFNSKYVLGRFKAKANLLNYEYGYNTKINIQSLINTQKLKGSAAGAGAEWRGKIKGFQLDADGLITPGRGRLASSYLKGNLSYAKDSLFAIRAGLLIDSKSPNFNFQLHQSSYEEYNWENDFDNIRTQNLNFAFTSKWIDASADFTTIQNYAYFDENSIAQQNSENITYLKVKASKEFRFGKFALDNTLMYQNVSAGSSVFRVPEFVTRNTLYYTDFWFPGSPLKVQIGATFKYFTDYFANDYNPLLSEFYLQNSEEIGFHTVDLFFNTQIRRTRIYFKIDNALSSIGSRNYFSAPNYPYRDFVFRFGLVWNWFI